MLIARVVGSAVSSAKDDRLTGGKLLLVRPASPSDEVDGDTFVAVDTVGAGTGELVLVVRGSAARFTARTEGTPTDAAIVGVIDSLEFDGEVTYRKA
ncbi:EutN/CcmL family microcompartment protein [Nitriliruptor alkaliphilus]|uniref:EutN/CcmL family microcompartment protein n=1 Tax=Nitriliruptor alkaliphilus TaxID=427918 RepID=UPI00069729F0|nr:EutN/CcmL family microcompartment protein [Nitriliruptor alkaliphilus]